MCDTAFDSDLAAVLKRACEAGVKTVLSVAEKIEDAEKNLILAAAHPMLRPLAGLYPSNPDPDRAEAMSRFILENRARLYGIGEVGLDYWIAGEEAQREVQKEIFMRFIRLSLESDLPLNVHSRSAGRHVIEVLLENGARRVQLHAFDGRASTALPAVEAGYFFSIPPSIVRSRQKQKLVRRLPLTSLLLETDSPVLGAEPGRRNEPSNVSITAKSVAEIKSVPVEAVLRNAYENTLRLYGPDIAEHSAFRERS
jgi:TatD DNase family protein